MRFRPCCPGRYRERDGESLPPFCPLFRSHGLSKLLTEARYVEKFGADKVGNRKAVIPGII